MVVHCTMCMASIHWTTHLTKSPVDTKLSVGNTVTALDPPTEVIATPHIVGGAPSCCSTQLLVLPGHKKAPFLLYTVKLSRRIYII